MMFENLKKINLQYFDKVTFAGYQYICTLKDHNFKGENWY